jgi:hypothetical protein
LKVKNLFWTRVMQTIHDSGQQVHLLGDIMS